MSSQAADTVEFPHLLDLLKQQFALTPNYARPLSDRIVGKRFDPA
jgi:hypothetical protein